MVFATSEESTDSDSGDSMVFGWDDSPHSGGRNRRDVGATHMDDGGATKVKDENAESTLSTYAQMFRGLDDKPVPVPPCLHYLYRGRKLAAFDHLNFFACFRIERKPEEELQKLRDHLKEYHEGKRKADACSRAERGRGQGKRRLV